MTFATTAPYAAALALIYVVLTQLVIITRNRQKVGLGDGGNIPLLIAIRRQANFVENVPLSLILLVLAEAGGTAVMTLNLIGSALLLARLIHPFGIIEGRPSHPLRIAGATITTIVQLVLIVLLALRFFA